ncbi:MAG TPA: hypothetical protein VNM41_03675 [Solirubrobacterales bacterium]|nr:hypothetical protein [Solirubrobacterales bacterium]
MPNDDWRLQIDFRDDGALDALQDRLDARELEHDLSEAFHDRVIVSRNETTIFLYAGDREQAEKARHLVVRLAAEDEEEITIDFKRWHPLSLEWEPADQPLPEDAAARAAEHQERIAKERQETEEQGYPRYEVQIELPSRGEADEFADRLRSEGLPTVRRWRVVLVGAADEDTAEALAERIRGEVPAGSKVAVAGSLQEAEDDVPGPFAFLGGLAG